MPNLYGIIHTISELIDKGKLTRAEKAKMEALKATRAKLENELKSYTTGTGVEHESWRKRVAFYKTHGDFEEDIFDHSLKQPISEK